MTTTAWPKRSIASPCRGIDVERRAFEGWRAPAPDLAVRLLIRASGLYYRPMDWLAYMLSFARENPVVVYVLFGMLLGFIVVIGALLSTMI